MDPAALQAHLRALLKPVPGIYHVPCAGSQSGIDDPIPVDGVGDRIDRVLAIGKLVRADGRIVGYVYRTTHGSVVMQTVTPPVTSHARPWVLQYHGGPIPPSEHRYSGFDLLPARLPGTVLACTAADYRNRRNFRPFGI